MSFFRTNLCTGYDKCGAPEVGDSGLFPWDRPGLTTILIFGQEPACLSVYSTTVSGGFGFMLSDNLDRHTRMSM